jgi:ribosomal protein L11 methyltransferase
VIPVPDFLELSFPLGALAAAEAEEACFAAGACAVTLEDAADAPVLEPRPGEVRLWPQTRLKALFVGATDEAAARATLASALAMAAEHIQVQHVADRPWEREWLQHFHALRFGVRLWVCPQHERVADPQAVVVMLDPGLAFGTGSHASTALLLEWLDAHVPAGASVIDYGCGSGVLALAAGKLGAQRVHCFDIDPQALLATRQNAAANHLANCIEVHAAASTLPSGVDLLLANILSDTLCALAEEFRARLHPGGTAVLGGILEAQAAEVTAAYAPWFDVERCGNREGWVALAAQRRA